jgi:O-antigen/teichoic acid export membrane protein
VNFLLCLYVVPILRHVRIKPTMLRPLLKFGSWITLSAIIGPIMDNFDRFLIGALASMTAVAYYATPYMVVSRLNRIPGAIIGVLFPAFSAIFNQGGRRTAILFSRGVRFVILTVFPLALLIITLAWEGLDFWLGLEFAQNSTFVLQCLTLGVFLNCMSYIPAGLIQGAGRPDSTAKLHLIELPCYLVALYLLIRTYGISGAAIAWTARVGVDAVLLFYITYHLLPESRHFIRGMAFTTAITLIALILPCFLMGLFQKTIFLIIAFFAFLLAAWYFILSPDEREFFQDHCKLSLSLFRRPF